MNIKVIFHNLRKKLHKLFIVLFFFLNVGIMIVDGFPNKSAVGVKFINLFSRYQSLSMLYQPWSMFAPEPMNTNVYIQADVEFEDGTTKIYPLPRQSILQNPRKVLVGDRYRILAQEILLPNKNRLIWMDVASFVAREMQMKNPEYQFKIKKIIFNRFFNNIPWPEDGKLVAHGTPSSFYNYKPVFQYEPHYGVQN